MTGVWVVVDVGFVNCDGGGVAIYATEADARTALMSYQHVKFVKFGHDLWQEQ